MFHVNKLFMLIKSKGRAKNANIIKEQQCQKKAFKAILGSFQYLFGWLFESLYYADFEICM